MNNLVPLLRLCKRLGLAFSAQRRASPTPAPVFRPGLSVGLVLLALFGALTGSLLGKHQAYASADTLSIDTYICGSDIQFPATAWGNNWAHVFDPSVVPDQTNHMVFDSFDEIWVKALGWQGGPCTGDYSFGWDQYYHEAEWTFTDSGGTVQQGALCYVGVFNPPWFFGATKAQYSLSITLGTRSQTVPFNPFDQNNALDGRTLSQNDQSDPGHDAARWVNLSPTNPANANDPESFTITIPRHTGDDPYQFTLTLLNGGDNWMYLGADAAHLICLNA